MCIFWNKRGNWENKTIWYRQNILDLSNHRHNILDLSNHGQCSKFQTTDATWRQPSLTMCFVKHAIKFRAQLFFNLPIECSFGLIRIILEINRQYCPNVINLSALVIKRQCALYWVTNWFTDIMYMNVSLQRDRIHFMYDIYYMFYHNTMCSKITFQTSS